ncbi:MAG: hypothetical protein K8T20_06835 [Planctomycetes bacterium]|nr:hypothetical protein [Planctomycetota bacterium]
MKPALVTLAALVCALTVRAEERLWQFHPGQTFSYTCESKFTYSVDRNKFGGKTSSLEGGGSEEPPPMT